MKKSKKNIVIIMLIIIAIMLSIFIGLLFTNNTSSTKNNTNKPNNNNTEKKESKSNTNENNIIEKTLPSGQSITINSKFKDIFNDNKKIKYTTLDDYNKMTNNNFEELTLSELLNYTKTKWQENSYVNTNCPSDGYPDKEIAISSTNFDLDNDGVNEIMISLCEKFILLHYYDGDIYGYILKGYRTNNNWTVNGKAYYSGSYIEYGYTKYTFNKDNLESEVIAASERDSSSLPTEEKINYKVEEKLVTKEEFDEFIKKITEEEKIEYVGYSAN